MMFFLHVRGGFCVNLSMEVVQGLDNTCFKNDEASLGHFNLSQELVVLANF